MLCPPQRAHRSEVQAIIWMGYPGPHAPRSLWAAVRVETCKFSGNVPDAKMTRFQLPGWQLASFDNHPIYKVGADSLVLGPFEAWRASSGRRAGG